MTSLDIGCHTLPGNRYGTLNQDYVLVQEVYTEAEVAKLGTKQVQVAAVLDGHGPLGEKLAEAAGQLLVRRLCTDILREQDISQLSESDAQAMFKKLFLHGHQGCMKIYDSPPSTINYPTNGAPTTYHLQNGSPKVYKTKDKPQRERVLECGATCSVAVLQGDTIAVASVGDSTVVLGSCSDDSVSAEVLSTRHYGRDEGEAARIKRDYPDRAIIMPLDGYLLVTSGPGDGYSLSVTRALGHKHLEAAGVICEPTVRRTKIAPEHCCLIIATDGVWDVIGPHEAVSRVMDAAGEGMSARQAARQLVEDAVKLGEEGPDNDADNASAVVIFF